MENCCMDDFNEWLQFARFDLEAAQLVHAQNKLPTVVIFHCHQCIEKVLKALWIRHGLAIFKTHDVRMLHQRICDHESWLKEFADGIIDIQGYFSKTRYPGGDLLTRDDAAQCMVITEVFFSALTTR